MMTKIQRNCKSLALKPKKMTNVKDKRKLGGKDYSMERKREKKPRTTSDGFLFEHSHRKKVTRAATTGPQEYQLLKYKNNERPPARLQYFTDVRSRRVTPARCTPSQTCVTFIAAPASSFLSFFLFRMKCRCHTYTLKLCYATHV